MYSNQNTFKELLLLLLSLTKRATLLRFIQPTLLKRKLVFKNAAFIPVGWKDTLCAWLILILPNLRGLGVTNGWGMRGRRIYKVNSTNFARSEDREEANERTKEERDKEVGQDLQIQTFEFRPLQEKL